MISKNISNHCQNSTFAYILYMKGQNRAYQKGYYKMTESEFDNNVEQKFDRYCKSVIGNGAKNARRVAENRLKQHMILEDMDENDPRKSECCVYIPDRGLVYGHRRRIAL